MVNQDIIKYLEEGKRRGFSIQLLKRKLLEGGFQEKDIDDAIAAMEVPATQVKKIDIFDKSNQFTQPSEQQMPIGPAQQNRQLPGQQLTFAQHQTSMQQPGQIQQKPEVSFSDKKEEKIGGSSEGKWMKVGGILAIVILLFLVTGVVLNFLANDLLMNLLSNKLTVLIFSIILVLMVSLFNFAFVRVGKKTNQNLLVLGSWFIIIPLIMYLIIGVVGNLFVYEQAINFFSGTDSEGNYKITFLILSIFLVVALLLHVIGMILSSIGMIRARKDVKLINVAGIINIVAFVCGLGLLAGIIVFVYSILNAFSITAAGMSGLDETINSDGLVAMYSLMGLIGIKAIAMIFEMIVLFSASRKFE